MKKNAYIGSPLESAYTPEEWEEVLALAQKQIIAAELRRGMTKRHVSEAELARRMKTSRTTIRRALDPEATGSTLHTVVQALGIVGKQLAVVDRDPPRRRVPARSAKTMRHKLAGRTVRR